MKAIASILHRRNWFWFGRRWLLVASLLTGWLLLNLLASCSLLLSPPSDSPHLMLGNPTGANYTNANNYLMIRPQYAMSYNRAKGVANWVSWQLNQNWLGDLPRQPFTPDTSLPEGWYQVQPSDYAGTGFDRGHLLPAADRDRTEDDAKSVFVMSNIIPQAPDHNRGPWERLESYSRSLAQRGKELYIIAGGAGTGGTGEKGRRETIAQGKVAVPASLWKIVVVLDQPGGLDRITENTRVIAVNMPNQQGIKDANWWEFKTSVDELEKLTGYNFLSNLLEPIQTTLEAKVDPPPR